MRRVAVLLVSLSLALAAVPAATLGAAPTDSWIVTLRPGVDVASASRALANQHGGSVGFVYQHALNGFSFRGSAAAAAALARSPQVTFVEADAEVWLDTTQTSATWGLDRIDQRALPLDLSYTYETTGSGVTAYVIDSGIRTTHSDFGGRATASEDADFVDDGRAGQDCNGHGTHVAGTIGGATYGVAKAVKLVSVRVFGCTGGSSWSTIIAAIDWVTKNARKPAVANLSLSGGGSLSVDNALKTMIGSGVGAAVAAGNSTADACSYSPARVPAAMTIGATDNADTKPSWSNYGSCVDWFAPGVGITSAGISSDGSTATKSGTSMAAPHTAGVAALYLQRNPSASAADVSAALSTATTRDIVKSSRSTNAHLLYSGFLGSLAPTTGTVEGVVRTAANDPIPGATVSLDGIYTATTDTSGAYSIASVAADTYTATASAAGYVSDDESVTVVAAETAIVNFSLVSLPDGGDDDGGTGDGSTFALTLAGSSTSQGSTWSAIVTATATDSAGRPLDGVTVNGAWGTSEGTPVPSCTTGSASVNGGVVAGQCQVYVSGLRKRTGSVTYTFESVVEATPASWNGISPPPTTVLKP